MDSVDETVLKKNVNCTIGDEFVFFGKPGTDSFKIRRYG